MKLNRQICLCIIGVAVALNLTGSIVFAEKIPVAEFQVAEGFEVSVWATTPQLYNPTNFDVDLKGRLWVTEAVNYRNFRNEALGLKEEEGDRVVVLTDSDGDGTADKSHTFVRDPDLVAPLGIGVIDNQVIVSCSPSIIIYTDVDRDLKFDPAVDKKEVFLTGFRGLDHDHSLHGVKAGPDGYWYFNVGNGGSHTVTDKSGWTLRAGSSYAGGSPHLKENIPGRKSDDGRVWVGGVAMRIRPDGTGLEPIGHNFRNVYEEAVTSFGDVFHADNDDPPACRTSWLMPYGNAGFSSADGTRGWMVDQRPGQPVSVAEWRQEDPGTMPAGDVYGYGAPTGVAFGENGCFDKRYSNGLLLVCESARGEIFSYEPKAQGAGFSLERSVFLKLKKGSSKQGWFRPSDVAIGPDGAIYVSDWYDPGVGGHRMTDATGSGTIYRIAPKEFLPKVPEFDLSTTEGQVAALLSPAVNVRALGWNALKDRGADAIPALNEVLANPNPLLAARAVWLLPFTGPAGLEQIKELMDHKDPQIRIALYRSLTLAFDDDSVSLPTKLIWNMARNKFVSDSSSAVRRSVALSLRDLPWEHREAAIQKLADGFDGWDRWYLEALGLACEGYEEASYKMLVSDSEAEPTKWDRRLAGLAWRLKPVAAVEAIASRVMDASLPLGDRKRMLTALAFISDESAAQAMLRIATEGPEDMQPMARWWGKNRDGNDWKEYAMGDKFPEPPEFKKPKKYGTPRLDFVLPGDAEYSEPNDKIDVEINIAGANRLYLVVDRIETEEEKKAKPKKWSRDVSLRTATASWLNPTLSGPDGETSLTELDWTIAFASGQMMDNPVGAKKRKRKWDRRLLPTLPILHAGSSKQENTAAPSIEVLTRSIIAYDLAGAGFTTFSTKGAISEASKSAGEKVEFSIYVDRSPTGKALPESEELAKVVGHASHGRALFFSERLNCAGCHSASGFGGGVGPDLTEIAKKHSTSVLLEGMVEPSAAISMGFETMMVLTIDGRVVTGLTVSAGDPVVLKDKDGKVITIPKDDIEEMKAASTSMMPDLKEQLTAQEIASLLAFLKEMQME